MIPEEALLNIARAGLAFFVVDLLVKIFVFTAPYVIENW